MAKILVIDDDSSILEYFRRLKDSFHGELVFAQSGAEGCRLVQDQEIKVVITDWILPGKLQQLKLLCELKRLRPGLPIIVTSGYSSDDIIDQCRQVGVTDFLTKPFELSFATKIVDRLMLSGSGSSV
ncbi:MAG: response regulator [Kiritimatiellia bacterium]|nr:response regulator [Lentisphaerota bacterium]